MKFLHWVGKTHNGYQPFNHEHFSKRIWTDLRDLFPQTYACILMPNHFHIISPELGVKETKDKLHSLSSQIGQNTRFYDMEPKIWLPLPLPNIIPDSKHLERQIRYVHLNPCRSDLTSEPLSWKWSTHLDYLGLVKNPWCNLKELRSKGRNFSAEFFHLFVSNDPTAQIGGTSFPKSVKRAQWMTKVSCETLHEALDLKARIMKCDLNRTNQSILSRLEISRSSLKRFIKHQESSQDISTLEYHLGDERLRKGR
ncbi:MAG: hypothetical protein KA715_14260 [Xanthomonadaceae bacterium]|nr:hypothetical protein [Xanthomonadaceae bacterium]